MGGLITNAKKEKKKKLNQEKYSTSVANAPTLYPLIVLLSHWIHIKHEKELLAAHLLKRDRNITVSILSVIFDGELFNTLDFWRSLWRNVEWLFFFSSNGRMRTVLSEPFKVPIRTFMLMLSIYEFRWQHRARKRVMDSSQNRWGRTSHQEPRISSWALNPSLCVWLPTIIGSGITGKWSAVSPSGCLSLIKAYVFIYIFLDVFTSLLFA